MTDEDKNEVRRFAKIIGPSDVDKTSIFNMYKKYVDNNATYPAARCRGCDDPIAVMWRAVIGVYNKTLN